MFKQIRDKNPTARFIASWSGGKDSTFMVDELLNRGDPLDEVVFCDTGWEFPEMYDYIEKCKAYWKSKKPDLKITLLNQGNGKKIWDKWAEGEYTRGEMEGKPRGFPFPIGMGWCTRELKLLPTKRYIQENYAGFDVFEYVGIAVDEPKRIPDGWENGTLLFPMVEWGITEPQALQILKDREMHNPLYNHFNRTGCWLCPKQSGKSLKTLRDNYPQLWQELKQMDQKYKELGATKGFKNIGIEVIESQMTDEQQLDLFLKDEPVGCFCK